jgi:hypothetical protein
MEERREVVETGPDSERRVVTQESTLPAAEEAAGQRQVVTYDPYAGRRQTADRLVQAVWLVFGIIEGLLAIRFLLLLLGANRANDFAQLILGVSSPFVAPFFGLFGTPALGGSVFELHTLVAMLVYLLLAWVVVKLVWLLVGETRSSVSTTASSVERRVD